MRTAVLTLVEMGCCLSSPAEPDGDGITMLPWLPDALASRVAANVRQSSHRPAKILINQEAIWRKLNGESVESLPHPATDNDRLFARYAHMRECRILVNQEAIFLKLQSVAAPS